jgi:hypothetical protein
MAVRLPGWVTRDWPLVGLAVAVLGGLLFAASALYGMVAAAVAAGSLRAIPGGAVAGAHLGFAAFGARTGVRTGGEFGSGLGTAFLPLPWAALAVTATWAALGFARRRLAGDRTTLLAFAGKLTLVAGVALGIIGGIVSAGDADAGASFESQINGGEVWFYVTLIVAMAALVWLRRQGVRLVPALSGHRLLADVPAVLDGAIAFALLAGVLGIAALVWGLVVADSGAERLGVLVGVPAVGLSLGIVAADVAMGAAAGTLRGHVSLFHFGLPAEPTAGAAPAPLFLALALAPALLAVMVWRRLERERPGSEEDAIRTGFFTGVGFALTAWAATVVSQVFLLAYVGRGSGFGGSVGTLVVARPSPATMLGLGLLWGLAAGVPVALWWARRHRLGWSPPLSPPPSPPPASPPPPPSGPPPLSPPPIP